MSEQQENKMRILLVDDDNFLLTMYTKKFQESGFEVTAVSSAEEALRKLKDEKLSPSVLLLDIIMPAMDGITLLQSIRDEKLVQDATIIMLTNQSSEEDITRAKALDIQGYIVKATTIPSEVVAEVRSIMEANQKG